MAQQECTLDLTPQSKYGRVALELAQSRLAELARTSDLESSYKKETLDLLIKNNLIAPTIPSEFGGPGLTETELTEIIEQITRYNTSAASMITCQLMAAYAIMHGGSDETKSHYLPRMASGEIIGVPAITEPEAGSDIASIATRAVKDEEGYILSGHKSLISFYGVADIYIVFAKLEKDLDSNRLTAFLVKSSAPGLIKEEQFNKLGQRGMPTGSLHLDRCRVSKDALLGHEGDGFATCMALLNRSRITVAAQSIGIAASGYQAALDYAHNRKAFGKRLDEHQHIAFKMADMAIKLHTARLATYDAAAKYDSKSRDCLMATSIAKTYASESAREIINDALQIHGGIGYTTKHDIERLYRDQRILEIYGGSSEIQRLIISRNITRMPAG